MIRIQKKHMLCIAIGLLFTPILCAQCNSWEGHPKGIEVAKEQHQMYRDLFRSKRYEAAFLIWNQLFQTVQTPKEAPRRHFKDGIKMHKEFAKKADKEGKLHHLDTILTIYGQLSSCVGENAVDMAWKGYDIYSLRGKPEAALEAFEKALDLGGMDCSEMIIVPMAQLSVYLFLKESTPYDKDYITTLYYKLKKLVDYNIENNQTKGSKYKIKWERAYREFYKCMNRLDEIWDCDFFTEQLRPMYLTDSMDNEQNKEILSVLKLKCGVNTPFYQRVLLQKHWVSHNCIGKIPIEKLGYFEQAAIRETQAKRFLKNGDAVQYEKYREQAYDLYYRVVELGDTTVSNEKIAHLCYRLAYESYQEGAYVKARELCLKASNYKPNWGEPYLLIGTLYVSSSTTCAEKNDNWNSKTVIWPAMDAWELAIRMDPEAKAAAKANIKRYRPYLPTKGEAFQRNLSAGNSYMVNCWIKQKTKVRVIKE